MAPRLMIREVKSYWHAYWHSLGHMMGLILGSLSHAVSFLRWVSTLHMGLREHWRQRCVEYS